MSAALRALVRSSIRSLRSYAPPAASDHVRLDANECPWPLPEEARRRVAAALASLDLHRYPDGSALSLRRTLAERLGGTPDEFVVGAGSDELIALLVTSLSEPRPGRSRASVLHPTPTFVMYAMNARVQGLDVIEVPLDEAFALDVPAMLRALERERPNLVFLASPNNPTGNVFDEAAIRTLVAAEPGALFVIDEAYGAYAGRSLAGLCDEADNVALLGTLSKIGLAGARLGWCRLPAALAGEVNKARQPYNTSSLSQELASLAFGALAPALDLNVRRVTQERERVRGLLAQRPGFLVHPSSASFLLVRFAGDAGALVAALRAKGVRVKGFDAGDERLSHHLRITVGTPAENDALIAALPPLGQMPDRRSRSRRSPP